VAPVTKIDKEGMVGDREYERSVVSSALWAAVGDAVGWTTELTDERGLEHRTGRTVLEHPTNWRRKLGRFGPTVPLEAGTYSDDTQLRLAVSRATRGSGEFDVEAFAKVELPIWPCYSLGGGKGTTAAALNLSRSSVSWFSNFFTGPKQPGYFELGGNGAAMRIQPHVWKSGLTDSDEYMLDVVRDAIVSHGHPKGFCGAVFHGLCLKHGLRTASIPDPGEWRRFAGKLKELPSMIEADSQLRTFWLRAWQDATHTELKQAVSSEAEIIRNLVDRVEDAGRGSSLSYRETLDITRGFDESTRGGGTNSALAAVALAWIYRDKPNEAAILAAANALGSDTDTIASMTGALLGAAKTELLRWPLQDRSYIETEARRLAAIATGRPARTFAYPDLMVWEPPANQIDVVCRDGDRLFVSGLGKAEPQGDIWHVGNTEWQWLKLEFGQTILAKRRAQPRTAKPGELKTLAEAPANQAVPTLFDRPHGAAAREAGTGTERASLTNNSVAQSGAAGEVDLDTLSERVIRSDFDPEVIGNAFLETIITSLSIERPSSWRDWRRSRARPPAIKPLSSLGRCPFLAAFRGILARY
jgi:ADP-ribosylglycohydrolase